jgi:hypothetical protein
MTDIAVFTQQQAREVWDTIKLLRSSGVLRNLSSFARPDDPGIHHVWIKNTSGEEIPAFACMQIDGTSVVGALTYVDVVKPTKTDGNYIFNHDNAIASGGYGMALPWGVIRMLGTAAAVENRNYGATVGAWTIQQEPSGPFVVYGDDNTLTNVHRGRIGNDAGKLVRFALLASLSTGTASATIKDMAGATIATEDVLDPEAIFDELDIGDTGLAIAQGGKYYVIQAACGVV